MKIEKEYYNVLVVDDDLEICTLLQEYLSKIPKIKNIVVVHDGTAALTRLRNQEFDLIMLDMKMPKKAGYDILGEIEADKLNSIEKVLIISGSIDKDIFTIAVHNGVKNFLVKPFDEMVFKNKALKILNNVLNKAA